MAGGDRTHLRNPELCAAIGRLIAKKGLSDVCIMEFESGVIVVGTTLFASGESYNRATETIVLSTDELKRMADGGWT